ncbi:hypothetical protein [Pseudoalteromonas sp. L1]|uniref:hypothetical protein n=1 Tax=Pseudoalteromonas sp. L1 TaxID=195716 RepID=UPI001F251D21|nr:hypothetical protein [Pseudoalteromonas sp. L1]
MSNWFENHPARSVIGHSVIVAAATWAAFYFVFDENKIKLIEAKSKKIAAEAKEVNARNTVLLTRLDQLTKDNDKYLRWLEQTPNTLPFYELEISKFEKEIESLKSELTNRPKINNPFEYKKPDSYEFGSRKSVGDTFLDPKTKASLGIQKINIDKFASVKITLPDGVKHSTENAKPGDTWDFELNGISYSLLLESLDWTAQRFTVKVYERPSKSGTSQTHQRMD